MRWNNEKFEKTFEQDIKLRKGVVFESKQQREIANSLFDQFLLIGVPPNSSTSPTILAAFPPFVNPNFSLSNVIQFCFPSGTKRHNLVKSNDRTIQDEFIFQMTSETHTIYGVCVHVLCTKKQSELPFYISKKTKQNSFCFCLLTRVPSFGPHFAFLTFLALTTFGKIPINNSLPSSIPLMIPISDPIDGLDLSGQFGYHPSIKIPHYFEIEIAKYFNTKISSPMISFHKNLECVFPLEETLNGKSALYASLDTLFSLLSPIDIIRLVNGLLLDGQILVIGSILHEVSMCIYALQEIIAPFKFFGTIIPILPSNDNFFELINLPTPFLIGVAPYPKLKTVTFLESIIFVNLDKGTISDTKSYPTYPQTEKIISNLSKLLSQHKCVEQSLSNGAPSIFLKVLNHRYRFTPNTSDAICQTILRPFAKYFTEQLCGFFVTDTTTDENGITIFNQELFLAHVPSRERDFYDNLVNSQTFRMYVENRIIEFQEKRGIHLSTKADPSFVQVPEAKGVMRTKALEMEFEDDSNQSTTESN
ncbi:uDENN domain containing protein [Histomonas meleagridis]|uniref:uDENN domain containing protein n=1 Tax=Histomonas meleagridis TaxID=135588 RepID=UPI003559638A|nr:uDENN domain containing protein [Histomonas meleagridis]KAH0800289.1 uDENN domain containing protein [Histomonas meleagridis]